MEQVINTAATLAFKYLMVCPVCENKIDIDWYVQNAREEDPVNLPVRGTVTCKGCDSCYSISVDIDDSNPVVGRVPIIGFAQVPFNQYAGLMLVKHHNAPTYLIVEHDFYVRKGEVDLDLTYYIDEHTCPTNWLKVLKVVDGFDPDPHGVFKFVRGITYKTIYEKFGLERDIFRGEGDDCQAEEEAFMRVFPEITEEGNVIEGEKAPTVHYISKDT